MSTKTVITYSTNKVNVEIPADLRKVKRVELGQMYKRFRDGWATADAGADIDTNVLNGAKRKAAWVDGYEHRVNYEAPVTQKPAVQPQPKKVVEKPAAPVAAKKTATKKPAAKKQVAKTNTTWSEPMERDAAIAALNISAGAFRKRVAKGASVKKEGKLFIIKQ